MTTKSSFNFGAMPPPGAEWQMERTAASIAFVNEATNALGSLTDPDAVRLVQRVRELVKSGKIELIKPLTVNDVLNGKIPLL